MSGYWTTGRSTKCNAGKTTGADDQACCEGILHDEGPGWLLPDLKQRWADPDERERLPQAARAVEREPALLGLPPHLLAVGRKVT